MGVNLGGNDGATDSFTILSPRGYLLFLHPPYLAALSVILVLAVLIPSLRFGFLYGFTYGVIIFLGSTLGTMIGLTLATRRMHFEVDREGVWRCRTSSRVLIIPPERPGVDVRLHFWFTQPFYLEGADLGTVKVSVSPVSRRYPLGIYPGRAFDDLVSEYAAMCEAWDSAPVAAPALRLYEGR
jgi:hypothetical protein